MDETIRDRIKRRVRWLMAIGLGGWLLFALGIVRSDFQGFPILNVAGFLMFGGAIFAIQRLIKCPRCSVQLGQLAFTLAIPGLKPKPNFCPYCGVSLDEPCSPAAVRPPAQTQDPIK